MLITSGFALTAQTQLANGGFESWGGNASPGISAEPTGWYSNKSGSSVAQLGPQLCYQDNAIVHSGTYSCRVETKSYFGTAVNGAVTTGVIDAPSTNKANGYIGTVNYTTSSDVRRTAFTGRPDSIVGYYQYTSGGAGEQGKIRVILHNNNYFDPETPTTYHADPTADKIADALLITPTSNATTWVRFSLPFTYVSTGNPSYVMINITSSANQLTTVTGSKMWVDDISFIYNPPSAAAFTSSSVKCTNSAISFTDQSTNSPTSWSWSFPGGSPASSTAQNPTVTYATAGTYTATLQSSNGSATAGTPYTYTFNVTGTPSLSAPSATFCEGATFSLTASGATTYTWNTGATGASIAVTPTATTVYTVTGENNGCTASIQVGANDLTPPVSVTSVTICAGGTATLNATGATSYMWNTSATTASIAVSPTVPTNYTVTGTALGCTNTAVGMVDITNSPSITVTTATICAGNSASVTAGGVSSYTWSTGSNNATINVSPTSTTVYTVSGQASGCGPSAPVTTTVTVNQLPNVSLAAITGTQCINFTPLTLSGSPSGGSYSGTAVSGNQFSPATAGAGSFVVTYHYTDANSCSSSANQTIYVSNCTGIEEVPTLAASVYPNPVSDLLTIRLSTVAEHCTIEIYDATGKLVLSSEGSGDLMTVNASQFTKGLYLLKLRTGDSRQMATRFIKQ